MDASADAAVLDVASENQKDAEAHLQFQDFSSSAPSYQDDASYQGTFPDSPDLDLLDDQSDGDDVELLRDQKKPDRLSPWSFGYYQSYFDVDTNQVVQRVLWSFIPKPGDSNFLERCIRPNPDLYGPFWICATLIFSTAISGNLASYLQNANRDAYVWSYDFNKVTLAATAVYTYVTLIPLALWLFLWYRKSDAGYTLLEILCIYGYSLAIYIPISILCVIQANWLQWLLAVVGSALSGSVLVLTLWPTVSRDQRKIAILVMVLIILCHFLLATGFVNYFFHSTAVPPSSHTVQPTVATTTPSVSYSMGNSSVTAKL